MESKKKLLVLKQFLKLEYLLLETLCFPLGTLVLFVVEWLFNGQVGINWGPMLCSFHLVLAIFVVPI